MNDLPVGRSVDEALRLVQAFQFVVSFFFSFFFGGIPKFMGLDLDRMNMGKYVRRIGRKARKRFGRIRRPSWTTLPPLMAIAANMRMA